MRAEASLHSFLTSAPDVGESLASRLADLPHCEKSSISAEEEVRLASESFWYLWRRQIFGPPGIKAEFLGYTPRSLVSLLTATSGFSVSRYTLLHLWMIYTIIFLNSTFFEHAVVCCYETTLRILFFLFHQRIVAILCYTLRLVMKQYRGFLAFSGQMESAHNTTRYSLCWCGKEETRSLCLFDEFQGNKLYSVQQKVLRWYGTQFNTCRFSYLLN
jgi:hypothetical protein